MFTRTTSSNRWLTRRQLLQLGLASIGAFFIAACSPATEQEDEDEDEDEEDEEGEREEQEEQGDTDGEY
ncbi:MAG: hypothetical protein HC893_14335 [Chloroflexaceae bacterium]|nr:hypothetical protein [Chloroflexaceae bacterium]